MTSTAGSGNLTVANGSQTLKGVKIVVEKNATEVGNNDSLYFTNRTGHTYYRAGDRYEELYSDDFDTGDNHKQGTFSYNVSIIGWDTTLNGGDGGQVDLTQAMLAGVAGDYFIRVTAADQGKISLSKTAALTTDAATPVVGFELGSQTAATGALGAAAAQAVDVAKINISAAGVVTFYKASSKTAAEVVTWNSGSTWAITTDGVGDMDGCVAQATDYVFVGIECKVATAENAAALSAYAASFTASVEATVAHS